MDRRSVSSRLRPCWGWAAPPGRAWARLARGKRRWPSAVCPCLPSPPATAGSRSTGPRICCSRLRASRSRMSASILASTARGERRLSPDAGSRAGRSMPSAPQSAMPSRRRRGRKPCASTCCPSGQRRRSRPACPAPQPRRVAKTAWAIACARPSTSIRCSGGCFSRGRLQERAKCSPKTSLLP